MMTWLMPIMLTWLFFFSAPSGLVLYWMVSNMVGVLIQLWINRMTADLTAEIAAAAATGSGGGGKGAARRPADKPGAPKRPKDKTGKRRQDRRAARGSGIDYCPDGVSIDVRRRCQSRCRVHESGSWFIGARS
jgi:hypothetical protein